MADEKTCPHCGKPVPPTALGGICPECMLKAGLATQTEGPGATGPHGTKVVPPLPKPEEIAPLFPQLEILECLGRGGMGVVYKARQPRLNRFVALKILAREKEQDAQFAERFTREAQALARLNHPNIVTVYDFGTVGQAASLSPSEKREEKPETGKMPVLHYLLMEFVDGLNLRQLLHAGKMPPEQALAIVPRICEALQYAHEQGIVHRDIKPENILLDKSGRLKIADFGIAKMLGTESGRQTLTGAKDAVGTPHYMAPEQIEKPLTVDHRADIYSLGVVFYEMLTGELPLGKFQPPSKKVHVDVRLDEVVLHALEKEPERRYQQASQIKTAVETITTSDVSRSRREEAQIEKRESQSRSTPAATAFRRGVRVALWVFILIVIAASVVTFLFPKMYVAGATVRLKGPEPADPYHLQTEAEIIQSQPVLEPVAASLHLSQRWGQEFNGGAALSDDQIVVWMKQRVEVRPIRNTALIQIRFSSDSPAEAAEIANKITETYCALPPPVRADIIERAVAPSHPARPNVPLNIFLGIVGGGVIGIFAGLVTGLISFWRLRVAGLEIETPANTAHPQDANLTCNRPARFGRAWKLAAFIVVLILCYELSSTVFSHLFAGRSRAMNSDSTSQTLLQSKVKYAAQQASVQDIVQNLAEQVGLKYDWKKSLDQTDPLCRQWVRNVTIDGETCQQALEQILKPVGLTYQVENGAIVLSRQDEGTIKSDYIGQAWFPQGDSIEITSVERTPEQMTVKGRYNLVSHDKAELALYITVPNTNVFEGKGGIRPISKGSGDFALVYLPVVPGLPHVSMYGADGHPFASLYFGTKDEALEESKAAWITNSTANASGDASQLAQEAWQLWQSGKLAEAEEKFQQAVGLAPDNANAWNGLGWAQFNSGNSQEAEKAFQKAVSLDPNQPGALNGLGQIYLSQRKFNQAETYLLKAAPQAPAAWYGLTRLYLLEGKYDQAEKWAQDLIDAGQADDLVRQMLKAAQVKHLSEGLRFRIEPPQQPVRSFETTNNMPEESSSTNSAAIDAVKKWLSLADNGDYAQTWETAADSFHDAITKSDWIAKSEKVRRPLGNLISRDLQSAEQTNVLSGMPNGSYLVARFDTAFAKFKPATETVIFSLEKDGQWKAVRYTILPAGSEDAAVISDAARPAISAAEKWLRSIDDGHYAKSWTDASVYFRGAVTQNQWVSSLESVRKPLGSLVSRQAISAQQMTAMPGAPDGQYVVMQFQTSFSNKQSAIETVAFMLEKDGQWKAAGYFIK